MLTEQLSTYPSVSCIMPTYNRHRFVPQAIRYFLEQDYPSQEQPLPVGTDGAAPAGAREAAASTTESFSPFPTLLTMVVPPRPAPQPPGPTPPPSALLGVPPAPGMPSHTPPALVPHRLSRALT